MSLRIAVAFLSGRQTVVEAKPDWTINDLRRAAELSLGAGVATLMTGTGQVLEGSATLSQAGLQNEETLTATIRPAMIAATNKAFAWIALDVTAWGHPRTGGDCTRVWVA